MSGWSSRIRLAASMPSVVFVGGIRMSVRTASGFSSSTAVSSSSSDGRGAEELDLAGGVEQAPPSPPGPGSYPRRRRRAPCADGTRGGRRPMTIRVVLGEDNVLVREGVRALLDSYDDIEVVGVAADAPTLLDRGGRARPRRRRDRHQDAAQLPARGHRLRARDPRQASRDRRRGARRPTTTRRTRSRCSARARAASRTC